jgi:hypothetical protein
MIGNSKKINFLTAGGIYAIRLKEMRLSDPWGDFFAIILRVQLILRVENFHKGSSLSLVSLSEFTSN